ncbi:MAG: pyruvate:ferredoxin (flavodoxin) oxidoreductase [Spirochaetia bacterium]
MAEKKMVTIDGGTAAAQVAHAVSEVVAIYPITPSSSLAEVCDELSAQGVKNIWGTVPSVTEMQSEAGAAGAVHGALVAGALSATFTASQGLLLMIPNMYKIAGELLPCVFHIPARALAGNSLSIFGDHSDVMSCRQTGFAMLFASSVQQTMDFAAIAHAATLKSRVPFMNIMDGFRTSHEVQKVEALPNEVIRQMIDDEYVAQHRARSNDPEHPGVMGTAQNPDVYFTSREASNKYYDATVGIVLEYMERFAKLTGRKYDLFDYYGPADAEHVIVVSGSGAETIEETIAYMNKQGKKYGILNVHLFRPFSIKHFVEKLPASVKSIAVLDRTKEPGSLGEPLYEDVRTAIGEIMKGGQSKFKSYPVIVGGRYGLGGAEFTPAMVKAVYENIEKAEPLNHFSVGIIDDLTNLSLNFDANWSIEQEGVHQALFYGLGSDGTVGANKNSIKIIGDNTPNFCQGYFYYDSKKAGTVTTSHLRFGPTPIKSQYLITHADFVACHKFSFLERTDVLAYAKTGATFLLASPYGAQQVWENIPVEVQQKIIDKKLKFYVIDALKIAQECGMGSRINVVMQAAFFKISQILPEAEAVALIKKAIEKTYAKKGQNVVDQNIQTVDRAIAAVHQVDYPEKVVGNLHMAAPVTENAPAFVKEVTAEIIAGRGHLLPTSKLPVDGRFPTATTQYEKRNLAERIPVWDEVACIGCGMCAMVCPHAVIRVKAFDEALLGDKPATFKHKMMSAGVIKGKAFTVQVSPEDCTGCGACINICPAKPKALEFGDQISLREEERKNWDFFLNKIPDPDPGLVATSTPLGAMLRRPLFEFSGACAGCGETPYVKLLTQLAGDRLMIANATGCSSIYGGNLPTTPYAQNDNGKGPSWANSLFEDAAEFGMGMRLTADKLMEHAKELLDVVKIDAGLATALRNNAQKTEAEIEKQRQDVLKLKEILAKDSSSDAKQLLGLADNLVSKSTWIIGGDGWAYDIGYGGLDHVLASGKNVKILVMDTEVYSNTGGQASKSTPIGASAKFAALGKGTMKKRLGLMQMMYGYVYVAHVSMGANMAQTIKAFKEAEEFDGPAIIIAYSHCISHGIDMMKGMDYGRAIVSCGMFPLYRYNPMLKAEGKNPFQLDSKEPSTSVEAYVSSQVRFKSMQKANPERFAELLAELKAEVEFQYKELRYLADRPF